MFQATKFVAGDEMVPIATKKRGIRDTVKGWACVLGGQGSPQWDLETDKGAVNKIKSLPC